MTGTILHSGSFTDRNDKTITVTFYQNESINVDPSALTFSSDKEVSTVTVWSNSGTPTLSSGVSWLTIGSVSHSGNRYIFSVTCAKNTSTTARSTTLTVSAGGSSKTVSVNQAAGSTTPTSSYYFYVKVVDSETRLGVQGVTIAVYSSQSSTTPDIYYMTDAEGVATLGESSSSTGVKYVRVNKYGYATTGMKTIQASSSIEGATTIEIDPEDANMWYYSVIVKDNTTGAGIANASVKFYETSESDVELTVYSGTTGTDGTYVYSLTATTETPIYVEASKTGYTKSSRKPILPQSSSTYNQTELILESESTSGYWANMRIITQSGKSLVDAKILVYDDTALTTLIGSGQSEEGGYAYIQTVKEASGYCYAVVSKSGYKQVNDYGYETSYTQVQLSTASATNVKEIPMKVDSTVTTYYANLIVKDSSGNAISGASVSIYSSTEGSVQYGTGTTGSTGTVSIALPSTVTSATTVYADITASGYTSVSKKSVTASDSADSGYVTVTMTEETPATKYYLKVHIVDEDGFDLNALVHFYTSETGSQYVYSGTAKTGYLTVEAEEGTYYALPILTGYTVTGRTAVTAAESGDYTTITMTATAKTYYIGVQAEDKDTGDAISDATVKIYSDSTMSGDPLYSGTTDTNGRWYTSYQAYGSTTYYAYVEAGGYNSNGDSVTSSTSLSYKKIEMRESGITPYYYRVHVTTDTTTNLSGVAVTLYDSDGNSYTAAEESTAGYYLYTDTTTGSAKTMTKMTASKTGYKPYSGTVTVTGQTDSSITGVTTNLPHYYWNITVYKSGTSTAISGASVRFYSDSGRTVQVGSTLTTNTSGQVSLSSVTAQMTFTTAPVLYLSISADGYSDNKSDTASPVTSSSAYETRYLTPTDTYYLNLKITDRDDSTETVLDLDGTMYIYEDTSGSELTTIPISGGYAIWEAADNEERTYYVLAVAGSYTMANRQAVLTQTDTSDESAVAVKMRAD